MSEWKTKKLGQLVDITSSKRIFYEEYVSSGVPFYRSKEVIERANNKRTVSTELFISKEKYVDIKNKFGAPVPGDLLLTSVGTLGIPYIVQDGEEFYFKDGNLTWFRNFTEGLLNNYLRYWIISPTGKETLDSIAIGSTQPALTIIGLKNIELTLPSLPEQKAIAEVLSSLDDKIDLLHRQNKTLEAMAEALFRRWFVEEADEEWEEKPLGELVSVVDNRGKTPPYEENFSPYPVIEVNALGKADRLVDYSVIKKYVNEETFNNWFRDKLSKYDTLISTVGSIGALSMYVLEKGNIAQNIIGLHAEILSPFYLYQSLKYKLNEIMQYDIGGVQPSIKLPHLLSIIIPIPPKDKQNNFDESLIGIIKKMENNYLQIRTLEKMRDTLLPKLMSGEVRVGV